MHKILNWCKHCLWHWKSLETKIYEHFPTLWNGTNHTSGNEIFRQMAKSIHFAINAFAHFKRFFSGSKTATFQALVGYCFYAKYLLFWKRHRFQINSKTKKTYLPICICFCIHFLFTCILRFSIRMSFPYVSKCIQAKFWIHKYYIHLGVPLSIIIDLSNAA